MGAQSTPARGSELSAHVTVGSVQIVGDDGTVTGCAGQLSEVLALLERARNLFGDLMAEPPTEFAPKADIAGKWVV